MARLLNGTGSNQFVKTVGSMFGEAEIGGELRMRLGKSLALVCMAGETPVGKMPIISEKYLPETVESVDGLKERAALYGCRRELDGGLNLLAGCVSGWQGPEFVHDGGDPSGPSAV